MPKWGWVVVKTIWNCTLVFWCFTLKKLMSNIQFTTRIFKFYFLVSDWEIFWWWWDETISSKHGCRAKRPVKKKFQSVPSFDASPSESRFRKEQPRVNFKRNDFFWDDTFPSIYLHFGSVSEMISQSLETAIAEKARGQNVFIDFLAQP